jgi:very-short-patch-repair endonuclease
MAQWQHGVVSRQQLLDLGISGQSIKHRVATGRLHPVRRGVYAVGRPQITRYRRWMAAVLSCGPHSVLSHGSAAVLWRIRTPGTDRIHLSVPARFTGRPAGVIVHRRTSLGPEDTTRHESIPVTTPTCTLIDIATFLPRGQLEAAINEADKLDLVDPETLRAALDRLAHRPGAPALKETLDRRTFSLTDSQLERRFLPLIRKAGLPPPETGRYLNGFKVDFYWPALGLVVETDGLRYHRTPAQQARDRLRDQAHTAAGLTQLRFTRAQVAFEPEHVQATLAAVARRLAYGDGR